MKLFSKEKTGNKRVIHFLGIKITYHKKNKNNVEYRKINFKTFQSLATIIRQNIHILPHSIDLVVGVPRSGMIPAYIIGLFLNKNVCTLSEFLNDFKPLKGNRPILTSRFKHILFVDDSTNSGNAMRKLKAELQERVDCSKYNFEYMAVFANEQSKNFVDYYFEIVENPRLFQWNYLNHAIACRCCFDIDGVLCVEPTQEQNDDGEKYINFLLNAKPLFIPRYEIHSIVTSRLEKYRKETEMWLSKHNIKYNNLYMLNLETAQERQKLNCHASFKAKIYKQLTDTICFIESEPSQAKDIAKIAKKQCICVSTDEYFNEEQD